MPQAVGVAASSIGDDMIEWPKTNRYCFQCKKVTKFILCDNCGKMYCSNHADVEVETEDYSSILGRYLVHLIRGKSC